MLAGYKIMHVLLHHRKQTLQVAAVTTVMHYNLITVGLPIHHKSLLKHQPHRLQNVVE